MDRQVSCANRWQRGINSLPQLETVSRKWAQCPIWTHTVGPMAAFGAGRPAVSDGPRAQDSAEFLKKTGPPSGETQVLCQKKLKGSKMAQLLLFF